LPTSSSVPDGKPKKIHKKRPQSKVRLWGVGETTPPSPLGAAARNRNRLILSSLVQQQPKKTLTKYLNKTHKDLLTKDKGNAQVQSTQQQQQHHYHHHDDDDDDDCR
jgi:hypothetical protein